MDIQMRRGLYGTPAEVSQEITVSTATLAQHRSRGTGPKFVKAGGRVLYRWSDVDAWLDANTYQSTRSGPGVA